MTRDKIFEALTEAGHAEHADAVAALIRPAIHLATEALAPAPPFDETDDGDDTALEDEDDIEADDDTAEEKSDDDDDESDDETEADRPKFKTLDEAMDALPLGASRIGGIPDLPPGIAWPTREDVPMIFAAQIRLADAAPHDVQGLLPESGSLLFFFNTQYDTTEMEPDARTCAVLFHDGPDDQLVRTPPPRVMYKGQYDSAPRLAPWVFGVAAVKFKPFAMVPAGISPFIPRSSPLTEWWQDFTCDRSGSLSMEPGHENHLLGYVDEQDYVDAHANGTDDQLLLQLDSEDRADMNWGDVNKLFFIIHKDALALRQFDHARVYMGLG